jgi:preprotein translocase subunit YajC
MTNNSYLQFAANDSTPNNQQQTISEVAINNDVDKAANSEFSLTNFVPLILIFAVFYFLIIRPQTKRFKEQQEILTRLKTNDKIITNSGIVGVIREIDEKENIVHLEIAESVVIKIVKSSISDLYQKEQKIDKKSEKNNKKNKNK